MSPQPCDEVIASYQKCVKDDCYHKRGNDWLLGLRDKSIYIESSNSELGLTSPLSKQRSS